MNIRATQPQEHPAQTLATGLHAILASLAALLLVRLKSVIAIALCNRISRARQRLVILLAHLAAGRTPRIHSPRPGRQGGPTPTPYIPQGRAWIFRALHHDARRHDVAVHATQLESLLHAPETLALLSTAPPASLNTLARTLRPLCRMLGVALPAELRPRVHSPRPPKPRRLPPAPAPPDRPLPRYVRQAVRAWKKNRD